MGQVCFGVDLGGTSVKMGLLTAEGKLLRDWEIPTRKEERGAYVLDDIAASVMQKADEEKLKPEEIKGIGIGVPGPVTPDGVVKGCVNIGWGDTPVEAVLKEKTGFLTRAGNDANVAALGELWQGGGKGFESLVMITLGTGVGGGIVLDGKIVSGTHGAAGEIGHMSVVYGETAVCNCGKRGCLEQVASATGIVKEAKRFLEAEDTPSVLRDNPDFSCKDVFDAAKKGDAIAKKTTERLGEYLGITLGHIACVIDPDVFIIGGGVSNAGDFLIDTVRTYYTEKTYPQCKETPIRLAALGNRAGIFGAAKLVLQERQ